MTPSLASLTRSSLLLLSLASVAPSVVLAQDATPIPNASLENQLAGIAAETAVIRDLETLPDINDVILTRDELVQRLPAMISEELDTADLEDATRALVALGLLPPGSDLRDLTLRILGEQVAGFYDPLTDEMIVVADGDFGAEAYYYSHEVVHALQDAYLDPDDRMEEITSDNDDQSLAMAALYEGDAVVTSAMYLGEHPELTLDLLHEAQTESTELDAAPAAMVVTLVFPYISGQPFVEGLYTSGGWDTVDAAYLDMPASTEQILHPEKYENRDNPVTLELPGPTTAMGDSWREVHQNTLGELQISLLLADLPPGRGFNAVTGAYEIPDPARNAAAGWDGDRYALWANADGQEALVWRTAWDTEQDARAFAAALARYEESRWGGMFNGESADDTALVAGDVAARLLLRGNEVFYVQSPSLDVTDRAQAALLAAPAPAPEPGPA
ncbi:MAG: hypothetical protein U0075_20455 [Thermomicrobiales bacterium]